MEDVYDVNDSMRFASDVVSRMEKDVKPSNIELTEYEKKQEEEAIISYDELIKTQSIPVLKYKNEEEINGLLVKAIDVNNLIETMDPKPISHPVTYNAMKKTHRAISVLKEEELVITLRKLDSIDK